MEKEMSCGISRNILHILPVRLRGMFEQAFRGQAGIEEIRIRIGQPPELRFSDRSVWLFGPVLAEDIDEMLTFISSYSIYAYEEEIRQGYLTVDGGHRIGFAGQVRMENGHVCHMTNIRFFNIRIAREWKGCAGRLLPWLYEDGGFLNTLLVSKPGAGKTTYLRDCVRMISNGDEMREGKKVCVIDERSEIAACHLGIPQNDIGRRTDVLDGCPKQAGMRMALRSLSPELLAVDELGGTEDAKAVEEMILSGCSILGTMHGDCIEHLLCQKELRLMHEKKLFGRYVFLKKGEDGTRSFLVYNRECERIC